MAIYVKNDDIYFYQGDSGNITFKGIPTDKNYNVYFAISDINTNSRLGTELSVESNNLSEVTFTLSAEYTNALSVASEDDYSIYQYGLKICANGDEYTLIPKVLTDNKNVTFSKAPRIYVYPKYAEGVE